MKQQAAKSFLLWVLIFAVIFTALSASLLTVGASGADVFVAASEVNTTEFSEGDGTE